MRAAILFANLKGNVGDFALLDSALLQIQSAYPDATIDVWPHGFLRTDLERMKAFVAAAPTRFQMPGKTASIPMRRLVRPLFRSDHWRHFQPHFINLIARSYAATAKSFSNYDRIFVVGGDQFDHIASASMFGTIRAISSVNPHISCFPISVNPRTLKWNNAESLREHFSCLEEPPLVRDEVSLEFLRFCGVEASLASDAAFALYDRIAEIESGEEDPETILLGVAGSPSSALSPLSTAIERLITAGHKLALFTTCEVGDKRLLRELAHRFELPVEAPLTWQDAVKRLKASKLVITNRLHGILLSAMSDSTVLPLGDREKTAAFIKETSVPFSAKGIPELTPSLVEAALHDAPIQIKAVSRYVSQSLALRQGPIEPRGI